MLFILVTQMISPSLMVFPLYFMYANLRLLNTYAALVLTYSAGAAPFIVWSLTRYFDTISTELEESALADGRSRVGAMLRVTLPLSAPGLAAANTYAFMPASNDFLIALILTSTDMMKTYSIGIYY